MLYSALSRRSSCFPLHYEPERTNRFRTSAPLGKSEPGLVLILVLAAHKRPALNHVGAHTSLK
uniref:Uncharacterized protein n=1 Tax=Hyaloperonospora arabidopsidis (strain Emoy2) TaxID=559515 RepID=M4C3N5_HYAAE